MYSTSSYMCVCVTMFEFEIKKASSRPELGKGLLQRIEKVKYLDNLQN